MPDDREQQSAFTHIRYYFENENGYDIVDTVRYQNKSIRIEKRSVEFTPTEVHLVALQSTTVAGQNNVTLYDPPKVLLKVPGIGQSLSWSYPEEYGQKTNFIAEWVKFKLNNVNTRALRVTETLTLRNGLLFEAKRIYYYREGIGLWKMEGETRELQQIICELVTLEYDSSAQK